MSIETLLQELKPVAVEDYEFEYGQKKYYLHLSAFSVYHHYNISEKFFRLKGLSTDKRPSNKTLMEDNKRIVTGKFEHRDTSNLLTLLAFLAYQDSSTKKIEQWSN